MKVIVGEGACLHIVVDIGLSVLPKRLLYLLGVFS